LAEVVALSQQRSEAQRAAEHHSNTLRGLERCRTSQQRSEAQRAAGHCSNTLRGPARYRPSQQRREVQCVASHRSNVATSSALLQQCRKNATSCSALTANAAITLRAATFPTIATALHVRRWTFVGRPSNFRPSNSRPTFVERPSNFRPSNFRPTSGPASLLTSSSCVPADVIVRHPAYVIANVTGCVIVLPSYALMSCWLDVLCLACCRPTA
jgi:hypothetical protein